MDIDLELVFAGDAPGTVLASHDVDLVLAPGKPEGRVELRPLFEDELVLVVSPDHHLADRATIRAEDLVNETYLTYNAQPTPGFEYDRFIRPSRLYPQIVRTVKQTSAITELVAAGAGVSILSRWALTAALDAGRLVAVSCGEEGLPLNWHAVLRSGDETAALVADELRDHLALLEAGPSI